MRRQQGHRQHHGSWFRQGDAAHRLGRIEWQEIRVQIERPVVLGAVGVITVGHRNRYRFAGEVLRRKPVADALDNRIGTAIRIGDGKDCRRGIAVDRGCQHTKLRELSRRQRNRDAAHYVGHVGRTNGEGNPGEAERRPSQLVR